MSVVVSFRIPRELKERLERLGIDWRTEVREFLERRAREEARKRILSEARRLRMTIGKRGVSAAELIREDRDAG